MKQSTKDKAKGKFHEVKGKVKQMVGRVTNNPNLEAEGLVEKIGGKVQRRSARWKKSSENNDYGSACAGRSNTGLKPAAKCEEKEVSSDALTSSSHGSDRGGCSALADQPLHTNAGND